MHEWSLAKTLLEQAERICREQGAQRLLEVRVQIGSLAGVEASLLKSAFDQLVCEQPIAPARLVVEVTPLVVRCQNCETESELSDFEFRCHSCHSRAVRVMQGDQLHLVSVTVDDEAEPLEVESSGEM